ncbi:MAG: hypothetical protein QXT64_05375, partial [Desulfurococcaceae archaeon]
MTIIEMRGKCTKARDVPVEVEKQLSEFIKDFESTACCILRLIRQAFAGYYSSKLLDSVLEVLGELVWEVACRHFGTPIRGGKPSFPVIQVFSAGGCR